MAKLVVFTVALTGRRTSPRRRRCFGEHGGDVRKLKSAAAWLQERKCPDEYGKADRRGDDGKPSQPSVDELARAVIAGRYGVGEARRKALGSRYAEVQRRVNQLLP